MADFGTSYNIVMIQDIFMKGKCESGKNIYA